MNPVDVNFKAKTPEGLLALLDVVDRQGAGHSFELHRDGRPFAVVLPIADYQSLIQNSKETV